ncbi:MAG: hypothetical protein QGH26_03125 [Candidatus Pacebacteria bacterium]|jgi:hypothetical protein|nr:hypothetical protein [Candidatus Paceibacterota bacterium]|tara:strand:- start:498 stop:923 length:426 start_codon:yes stop_codon:yes gene_type:complete
MTKTQLLCTFTRRNRLHDTVDVIIECNEIVFSKIYVFQNEKDYHQLICTYNIEYSDDFMENVKDTISLHRKKQTNTLYTINALNEVIRSLNEGILDKTFSVPWEEYKNSLLLTNEDGLNIIPTRIYSIIDVNTWDRNLEGN